MDNPQMSYREVQHLLEIFRNVSSGRFTTLVRSGFLSDLIKADFAALHSIDRDQFRVSLGLHELSPGREVRLLSEDEVHEAVRQITSGASSCFQEFEVDADFKITDIMASVSGPNAFIRFIPEVWDTERDASGEFPEGFRHSTFREIVSFVVAENPTDKAFLAEDRPIRCDATQIFPSIRLNAPEFQQRLNKERVYFSERGKENKRDLILSAGIMDPRQYWRPMTKL